MQELARLCGLAYGRHPARAAVVLGQGLSGQGQGRRPWLYRVASDTAKGMSHSTLPFHSGRSYEDAVSALNSLQSNAAYLQETKELKRFQPTPAEKLVFTRRLLELIGVGPKELSKLSVIHVAGTKGKGSTSAYCESILRRNGYCTGFFSSPHLISVRERIRINGQPLSTQKFTSYFWNAYETLQEKKDPEMVMPAYFLFLTVMALRVFLEEQVDVAVVEVGIGGEFDCTNILQNVSVVGITSLGIDHTALLGNSLASIAWQKAGILKPSAVGFTVPGHTPEALKVLEDRSLEKLCPLEIVPPLDQYTWPDLDSRQAALSLFWTQQLNASLALQLTNAWMKRNDKSNTDDERVIPRSAIKGASPFPITSKTAAGVLKCQWPGRNQIFVSDCGRIKYFLDGAHTPESMEACVEWYQKACPLRPGLKHALLLNVTGDRDRSHIIKPLLACKFDKVIFSPNIAYSSVSRGEQINLTVSHSSQVAQTQALHDVWISLTHTNEFERTKNGVCSDFMRISLKGCVNEALAEVQNENAEWSILVTGSLHLVGAVLSVIDPSLDKCEKVFQS